MSSTNRGAVRNEYPRWEDGVHVLWVSSGPDDRCPVEYMAHCPHGIQGPCQECRREVETVRLEMSQGSLL